jgi:phosphohistidine phosphatase
VEICLVRHGIAVERGTRGFERDELRPLTAEGRRKMAQSAAGLARLFAPEGIFSSPLVRAWQTAEILAKAWKLKPKELDSLGDGDHAGVLEALRDAKFERVALVGHEPWMTELLALLVSGGAQGLPMSSFKKGGAALVSGETVSAGKFSLEWFIQPGMLRRLA